MIENKGAKSGGLLCCGRSHWYIYSSGSRNKSFRILSQLDLKLQLQTLQLLTNQLGKQYLVTPVLKPLHQVSRQTWTMEVWKAQNCFSVTREGERNHPLLTLGMVTFFCCSEGNKIYLRCTGIEILKLLMVLLLFVTSKSSVIRYVPLSILTEFLCIVLSH